MPLSLHKAASAVFLLCAGSAAAQTEVPSTPPRARMTFEVVETAGLCDDCLVVQGKGRIVDGTGSDFWGFIARNKMKKTIVLALHSPGGLMQEAMTVSSAVRKLNARTVVGLAVRKKNVVEIAPGVCLSACLMMFAGGTQRAVPPGSEFGVHAWMPSSLIDPKTEEDRKPGKLDRQAVQALHAANARYMSHLDQMGIDLRIMVRVLQTPFERMTRLNAQELKDFKIITGDEVARAEPGRSRPVLALPRPPVPAPPATPSPAQAGRATAG